MTDATETPTIRVFERDNTDHAGSWVVTCTAHDSSDLRLPLFSHSAATGHARYHRLRWHDNKAHIEEV